MGNSKMYDWTTDTEFKAQCNTDEIEHNLNSQKQGPKVCMCNNSEFGFDCVCSHIRDNPGVIEYTCEFCGIYKAGKPRCNKCKNTV